LLYRGVLVFLWKSRVPVWNVSTLLSCLHDSVTGRSSESRHCIPAAWFCRRHRLVLQCGKHSISRDGVVIALPTVTIEIAQECSGIRSSLILVIAGLVLGHLFLGKTWAKFVLVALLVPLTIAKNALRIFTLSTLGMYVIRLFYGKAASPGWNRVLRGFICRFMGHDLDPTEVRRYSSGSKNCLAIVLSEILGTT